MNMFTMLRPLLGTEFSSYTTLAASMMVAWTVLNNLQHLAYQFIPAQIREKIINFLAKIFFSHNTMTLTLEKFSGVSLNEVFAAAETYLGTRITPSNTHLKCSKTSREDKISLSIYRDETIVDHFDGIKLVWWLTVSSEKQSFLNYNEYDGGFVGRARETASSTEQRTLHLRFDKRFKDKVVGFYLPHVMERANAINTSMKKNRLYSLGDFGDLEGRCGPWSSVDFDHPATFETLAMDEEMKKMIIHDLDMFVKGRNYYKNVGKAWKRGYLLYGPPGTGKSTLVAAMANYLRFDVYDLQLSRLFLDLRQVLVSTTNKSILVIEDIDCTIDLENRKANGAARRPMPARVPVDSMMNMPYQKKNTATLSELLNFADGLWSSSGDERIIIFTTNYKEKLDPALLRPGRMDMHIHMSYLTPCGFKTLAFNYLEIKDHPLLEQIEERLTEVDVTPAEVAEKLLMKRHDANLALEGLVEFLESKKKMILKPNEIVTGSAINEDNVIPKPNEMVASSTIHVVQGLDDETSDEMQKFEQGNYQDTNYFTFEDEIY